MTASKNTAFKNIAPQLAQDNLALINSLAVSVKKTDRATTVLRIKEKIRGMGQDYQPGNASKPGHTYSPIPFPEFSDVPYQRNIVEQRFKIMRDDLMKLRTSGRLLDVGCHTGFNCFKFDAMGFECTGVEADPLTCEIATDVARLHERPIEFRNQHASADMLDTMGQFDVVLMLAVFQWIAKANGYDAAVATLKRLTAVSDILYFETSMGTEGKAKMPMLPDATSVETLLQEAGHPHVTCLAGLDRNRYLFRTARFEPETVATDEQVRRAVQYAADNPADHEKTNNYFHSRVWNYYAGEGNYWAVKLVRPLVEEAAPLLRREHEFLKRVTSRFMPTHIAHGRVDEHSLLVSQWKPGVPLDSAEIAMDRPQLESFAAQLSEILDQLQAAGIEHRDIRPANLLWDGEQLSLIDFGWAKWATESNVFTPAELLAATGGQDLMAAEAVLQKLQQPSVK